MSVELTTQQMLDAILEWLSRMSPPTFDRTFIDSVSKQTYPFTIRQKESIKNIYDRYCVDQKIDTIRVTDALIEGPSITLEDFKKEKL